MQTLLTFETPEGEEVVLPKEMNNMQFTEVLHLWKKRVVDIAKGKRATVLQRQYENILHLQEYRNALIHGMWQWSKEDPEKINTIRIRKKEVITTHFTADSLQDFYKKVAKINFKLRHPEGMEDFVAARSKEGFYISRLGLSLFTGNPVADDLFPSAAVSKKKETP